MLGAGASHPAPATEPRRAGQNSRAKAMLTLWIDTTAHRSRQVTNEAGAASRHTRVQCLVGCGNSSVCKFDEHVGVAALGCTPAHEILAAQFVQRRHECWLPHDPCAVFRDHLVTRAVAADHERVAPLAGATDLDAIRPRAFADLSGVENLAHDHLPSPMRCASAAPSCSCSFCAAMAATSSA